MGYMTFIATMTVWSPYVLGQITGDPPAAADAAQSILDFVVQGGPVMIPIGMCSLVALTVIIERLISLRRSKIIPSGFQPALAALLSECGESRRQKALDYCKQHGTSIAAVFAAGIKELGRSVELVERHVQEAGQREVLKLCKFLRTLSVIAAIAPLLGLLGTILGMITAFETVAASAEALGRTELLAKGIYEAMITTASGLIVTIPVVIAYHWFSARVERFVAEIDVMVIDFIENYVRPVPSAGAHVCEVTPAKTTALDNEDRPTAAVALAVG